MRDRTPAHVPDFALAHTVLSERSAEPDVLETVHVVRDACVACGLLENDAQPDAVIVTALNLLRGESPMEPTRQRVRTIVERLLLPLADSPPPSCTNEREQETSDRRKRPLRSTAARTQRRRPGSIAVRSPLETYLRNCNELPLLRSEEERAWSRMLQESHGAVRDVADAIRTHLPALLPESQGLRDVHARLKRTLLSRAEELERGGSALEYGESTDAVLRTMAAIVSAKWKATTRKKMLTIALDEGSDDSALLRNFLRLCHYEMELGNKVVTGEAREAGALLALARESRTVLRAWVMENLPPDHPCRAAIDSADCSLQNAFVREPACREYLAFCASESHALPRGVRRVCANSPNGATCLYRIDETTAMDVLIRANLRLVVKIARSRNGLGFSLQDLIEDGNLGLTRAAEGFDSTMGMKFSTYASFWIKQGIRQAISSRSHTIRIPAYLQNLARKFKKEEAAFREQYQREPTPAEICSALGISQRKYKTLFAYLYHGIVQSKYDPCSIEEHIEDRRISAPDDANVRAEFVEKFFEKFRRLDQREQEILQRRYPEIAAMAYPFESAQCETLKTIGRRLGLTRERVRQIERDALLKLREMLQNYT